MGPDPLETYLRDHHAGSSGGVSLIERLVDGTDDESEKASLAKLQTAIEEDQDSLEKIMDGIDLSPNPVKDVGARIGERLSRPKLHSNTEDARVLQLEGMIMGVTAKLQLWRTLRGLCDADDSRFDRAEIERLHARAEEQRSELERIHGETGGFEPA